MEQQKWREATDGPHTVASISERLKKLGFSAQRIHYPARTWVPQHSNHLETIDVVVVGSLTVKGEQGGPVTLTTGQAIEFSADEVRDFEAGGGIGAVTVHGVRLAAPKTPLWRYLVLAGLAAAANVWSWLQFGSAVDSFVFINAAIAALPAVLGKAGGGAREAYQELWKNWIGHLVSTRGLVTLGVLFVFLTGFSSSVRFESGDDEPIRAGVVAQLQTQDEPSGRRWAVPGTPTRFWRWTHPFGREAYLQVEGYEPEPVALLPWRPERKITVDLEPRIALVLRVDPGLPKNGWLAVEADWEPPLSKSMFEDCPNGSLCFPLQEPGPNDPLAGRAAAPAGVEADADEAVGTPVQAQTRVNWAFFLNAGSREVPGSTLEAWAETENRAVSSWLHPAEAPRLLTLRPKDQVIARVFSAQGSCRGEEPYKVGRSRFQSIYLKKGKCLLGKGKSSV